METVRSTRTVEVAFDMAGEMQAAESAEIMDAKTAEEPKRQMTPPLPI